MTLPSYEDLAAEIEALPAEAKKNAVIAMKAEVTSEKTKRTLAAEVEELATTAKEIDTAFDNIALKLKQVDVQAAQDKWEHHESFYDGWVQIRDKFRGLLKASRDSANSLSIQIQRFMGNVLEAMEDQKLTLEQKKGVLKNFKKSLPIVDSDGNVQSRSHEAYGYEKKFRDLANEVQIYALNFEKVGVTQKAVYEKTVTSLETNIKRIKDDLEEIKGRIIKWASLLGATVVATGAGVAAALICLGPLGPIAAGLVALAGLAATATFAVKLKAAVDERDAKEEELKNRESDLAAVKGKLERLEKVTGELKEATKKVDGIVARIGKFEDIWKAIGVQTQTAEKYLDLAIDDDDDYSFGKDVRAFWRATFETLYPALDEYALMIKKAGFAT